jgi:large subunit ribosomal protein L29
MKIEKFREMTQDDLKRKLEELRDNLLKTRVKVQTKQAENTAQLSTLRRDIARVQTLLGDYARGVLTAPVAAPVVEAKPGKTPGKEKGTKAEKAEKAQKAEKVQKGKK